MSVNHAHPVTRTSHQRVLSLLYQRRDMIERSTWKLFRDGLSSFALFVLLLVLVKHKELRKMYPNLCIVALFYFRARADENNRNELSAYAVVLVRRLKERWILKLKRIKSVLVGSELFSGVCKTEKIEISFAKTTNFLENFSTKAWARRQGCARASG